MSTSRGASRRKICVVSSSRADYGHLYWILRSLQADPRIELQILVTGMHLHEEFGFTYQEFERDGFSVTSKVDSRLLSDTPSGIAESLGVTTIGAAKALASLKPDLLVVLGDRFEILGVAQAAHIARIPIAHIHGGESTEGAIDEAIRHSLTKLSQLHFVAAEAYRNRVIQLGEKPDSVFNFGAPGLDQIVHTPIVTREEINAHFGIQIRHPYLLVVYHPVTLDIQSSQKNIQQFLEVLQEQNKFLVFTGTNADTDGKIINKMFCEYAKKNAESSVFVPSFGRKFFYSVLAGAELLIGNSSSGLIEAPFLKTISINIGDRQKGRLRANSVIDVPFEVSKIREALSKALSPNFRKDISQIQSPYGQGDSSGRIASVLAECELKSLKKKSFFDLAVQL